jgi:hypothetical protein
MSEINQESHGSNKVAIAAIIVTGIVLLACIAALTAIAVAFVANPPW